MGGLWQFGHFQKLFQIFYRKLHLAHVFRKDFQLGQRSYHRNGEHHRQRHLRPGDHPAVDQGQRYRQRAYKRRRKQGKAQLHGSKGAGQPLDHKGTEIANGGGILFVADACPSKGLNDLDAFYIFHNSTVHIIGGLVILFKIPAADFKGKPHAQER